MVCKEISLISRDLNDVLLNNIVYFCFLEIIHVKLRNGHWIFIYNIVLWSIMEYKLVITMLTYGFIPDHFQTSYINKL